MSKVDNNDVRYHIVDEIGAFSDYVNGFRKEVNIVQWNGGPAKIDVRSWNEDHTRCSRGMTFTDEEFTKIMELAKEHLCFS